jgi:hypothetical protein
MYPLLILNKFFMIDFICLLKIIFEDYANFLCIYLPALIG